MQNQTQNNSRPKKAYKAPTLTDYGTVEQFTTTPPAGPGNDGTLSS